MIPIPADAIHDTQPPPSVDSRLASRLVQARHYRPATGRVVTLVVLHDMEAGESTRTAENVAAWFAGPSAPMASAHYCLDCDSIVQAVREADVAYAAPGANAQGIHLELAGYARQTEADWEADAPLLFRAAELVADVCRRHALDVRFVDAAGLLRGESGITTHAEVSKAFKKSDHTDPGPGFPLAHFLELVQDCVGGAALDAVEGRAT